MRVLTGCVGRGVVRCCEFVMAPSSFTVPDVSESVIVGCQTEEFCALCRDTTVTEGAQCKAGE